MGVEKTAKVKLAFILHLMQRDWSYSVQLIVRNQYGFVPVTVFVVDTYPAWIVGLRGLWPSTKIWLSQPETTPSPLGGSKEKEKYSIVQRKATLKRMAMPVEVRTTQCWEMLIPLCIFSPFFANTSFSLLLFYLLFTMCCLSLCSPSSENRHRIFTSLPTFLHFVSNISNPMIISVSLSLHPIVYSSP